MIMLNLKNILKKKLLFIMALVVLTPLNAGDESVNLINDIDQWVNVYLQGDIDPVDFSELIGGDLKLEFVDKGLIMFTPKNSLLSGGDLFFKTKESKKSNRLILDFKNDTEIRLEDLVKILGAVDSHRVFDLGDSVFSYDIGIEREGAKLSGVAFVETRRKNHEEEFVNSLTISIVGE